MQELIEKQRSEFTKYLKDHEITVKDFEEAYDHLWEGEDNTLEDSTLLSEMRRLVREGFPHNGFVPLLEKMRREDRRLEEQFVEIIDKLTTSDKEKNILSSIGRGRVGQITLTQLDSSGKQIARADFRCDGRTVEARGTFLMKLKKLASDIPAGVTLEVEFIED